MDPFKFNIESDPSTVPLDLLPTLVTMARSDKPEDVFQGVMLIRKLLSVERNTPIQEVVDTGVAEVLAKCMANDNTDLQHEASWALTNIASGKPCHTWHIIDLGVVPLWIGHLSSGNDKCQEQALWAIGNVAGNGAKSRDRVLEKGAMQPLLDLIRNGIDLQEIPTLLQTAVWALSNLCRAKPPPAVEYLTPATPVLANFVHHPDPEVAMYSMWALSYIAEGSEDRIQLVIDSGVVTAVVEGLGSDNTRLQMAAIRIIGKIGAGNDKQRQTAVNAGCMIAMKTLLNVRTNRNLRKEAVCALTNFAAGNEKQIQAVIDAGLLPAIVSTIDASEAEVKREAICACSKLISSGYKQLVVHLFVECGVLRALCEALNYLHDAKILQLSLETILGILGYGADLVLQGQCTSNPYVELLQSVLEGSPLIEDFKTHSNPDICRPAQDIIANYMYLDGVE